MIWCGNCVIFFCAPRNPQLAMPILDRLTPPGEIIVTSEGAFVGVSLDRGDPFPDMSRVVFRDSVKKINISRVASHWWKHRDDTPIMLHGVCFPEHLNELMLNDGIAPSQFKLVDVNFKMMGNSLDTLTIHGAHWLEVMEIIRMSPKLRAISVEMNYLIPICTFASLSLTALGIRFSCDYSVPVDMDKLFPRLSSLYLAAAHHSQDVHVDITDVVFPPTLKNLSFYHDSVIKGFMTAKLPPGLQSIYVSFRAIGWVSMEYVWPRGLTDFTIAWDGHGGGDTRSALRYCDAAGIVQEQGDRRAIMEAHNMIYNHQDGCMWLYMGNVLPYDLVRKLRDFLPHEVHCCFRTVED
jgi:hypothetical protein